MYPCHGRQHESAPSPRAPYQGLPHQHAITSAIFSSKLPPNSAQHGTYTSQQASWRFHTPQREWKPCGRAGPSHRTTPSDPCFGIHAGLSSERRRLERQTGSEIIHQHSSNEKSRIKALQQGGKPSKSRRKVLPTISLSTDHGLNRTACGSSEAGCTDDR